jgi:tetratricopeptide (TPR) repeat protein
MTTSAQRLALSLTVVIALLAVATPVAAQTGAVRGRVVGLDGKPVSGVRVTIELVGGTRVQQAKTDRRGEFVQIGLAPGAYRITAIPEKLPPMAYDVNIRGGQTLEVNFVLQADGGGEPAAAVAAALKKVFQEGVALSQAGDHDGAIGKFEEAAGIVPDCFDCHYNIGYAFLQKKDEKKAESAFLKALELKADYTPALNTLATLYNSQKRFDEASAMSSRAATAGGGTSGGVDAIYNQGIILWNGGSTREARTKFEEAIGINPEFAPAHFQLGMAQLNEGQIPDAVASFETYLRLAPQGEFAAQATAMVAQLKP